MDTWWRVTRGPRLRLIGLAAALVLAGAFLWVLRPPGPDARLEAIRQQGYPVTLAELDAWYRPVPDTQNLALVCSRLFASPFSNTLNEVVAFTANNWPPPRGQALAPEDRAELTALLSTNEARLRPLYCPTGPSRYPVDLKEGFAAQLPYLRHCKSTVNLLTSAALLHAGNGETERAVQDLAAAARVADTLAEEPLLISQMVRMICWSMIGARLERVLSVSSLNAEQLARLQTLVADAEKPQNLARALAGERTAGLALFHDPTPFFSAQNKVNTPPNLRERLRMQTLINLLKVGGFFSKDRAFYLDAMATNVGVAELPFPERVSAGKRINNQVPPSRYYVFSGALLPSLHKALARDAETCANLRTAQAALAIERFRLAHTNALPASLAALVPTYLKALPTDPYNGQPLRYKLKPPGYVVYSLGPNGSDEGGLDLNSSNPAAPLDIPFTLEK